MRRNTYAKTYFTKQFLTYFLILIKLQLVLETYPVFVNKIK